MGAGYEAAGADCEVDCNVGARGRFREARKGSLASSSAAIASAIEDAGGESKGTSRKVREGNGGRRDRRAIGKVVSKP